MLPLKFLKWFCRPEYHIDIEGDLLEMYEKRVIEKGPRKAKLLLWRDVILLCRPGMIRRQKVEQSNLVEVTHHNILISFRNFRRNRTAFFINIGSLSVGLTCALLIYTWVHDEMSVDQFHEKLDRIYKVKVSYKTPAGISTEDYTPSPLAEVLASELPEVEYATSVNPFVDWFNGPGIVTYNNKQAMAQGLFASNDFFNVFSYKVLLGDNSGIMISSSLAKKLFASETDAIGKLVDWTHIMRLKGPFAVTGVFEDIPENSTSKFDLVFRYEKLVEGDRYSNTWNSSYSQTSVLLREGANVDAFNEKITDLLASKDPTSQGKLSVARYTDEYLYNDGRIAYVRLFSLVAVFTLAIACINFINLSTAQASRKLKMVGVKKALGVSRRSLVGQFLTESMIMVIAALVIAVGITTLLLPAFSLLTGKHLQLNLNVQWLLLLIGIGILAGGYPALFLSGFKAVEILKGKLTSSTFGEIFTRKTLVILQFVISIVFIVGFAVVNRQIDFVQTRNLGYTKENVIRFARSGSFDNQNYEAFIHEIKTIPGVINASSTNGDILDKERAKHIGFSWEGQNGNEKEIGFPSPWISHDYVETMGMELIAGRTFVKDISNEDTEVIVNEAAVKMMNMADPVGKTIEYGDHELKIVGVLKDFHYGSLHTKLDPVFFMYAPVRRFIVVRIQPGSEQATIEQLSTVYQKFHGGYPFEFTFLDDDYNKLYASESRVSQLSTYSAIVATLISCLGLFGLAVFSSERRTKEIGIRKVLGATTFRIVGLLASDIVRPVFIAILIAVPVSYLIALNWLAEFAYRIDLSWWFFAGASLAALFVTWITVGLQTFKAARANPVDSLKTE